MQRLGTPNVINLGLEAHAIERLQRQVDEDPQVTFQLEHDAGEGLLPLPLSSCGGDRIGRTPVCRHRQARPFR